MKLARTLAPSSSSLRLRWLRGRFSQAFRAACIGSSD